MRRSPPNTGFTLRNLLQIGLLCGVIAGVPALATGVRQVQQTVRSLLAQAPEAAPRVPASVTAPVVVGDAPVIAAMRLPPGLMRLASWCQAAPDGTRLCRV